ncbi:MAG TPA: hypothetical protein PKZ42_11655 [Syntrophales bacterium]|nr:hypothetical protein [Syntrophales bacterium]
MINSQGLKLIYDHAYIPEHLPHYVEEISSTEAHLLDGYLCYTRQDHLIFTGYPLDETEGDTARVYESALKFFKPATVSVIAPELWFGTRDISREMEDAYYRMNLPISSISLDVSYMIRRADREVIIGEGEFGSEHRQLIRDFIRIHDISPEHEEIFNNLNKYLERSDHARLLEARKENNALSAFTIVDLGSAEYAFYLFNFRSPTESVPGVSDLLFYEMARLSNSEGKRAINLGLGINQGNRWFKEKWGGAVFIPYRSATINTHPLDMDTLLNKL